MRPQLTGSDSVQPIAVCPEHPERASIAPCERCGRFLCDECHASRSPPLCEACAARTRDPLGILAQPFSIGGALNNGWRLFRSTLPRLLPISLLIGIPGGLFTHFIESNGSSAGLRLLERVFDVTIGLVGIGAYLALLVGAAEGAPRSVGAAFKEGSSAWPRLFSARLRSGLTILLMTLLLIIPGIMMATSLAVTVEAAFREPKVNALDNSTQLTAGRRWEVFGLFMVGYFFVFLGVLLIGGIGALAIELAPGIATTANILIDAGIRLGDAFGCAVSLAAFYGLKRSQGHELAPLGSTDASGSAGSREAPSAGSPHEREGLMPCGILVSASPAAKDRARLPRSRRRRGRAACKPQRLAHAGPPNRARA